MQIQNYVKLGVLAQKAFDLPDDFKVIILPAETDPANPVMVEVEPPVFDLSPETPLSPFGPALEYDRVDLQLAVDKESGEFCFYGWAPKAKALCVLLGIGKLSTWV